MDTPDQPASESDKTDVSSVTGTSQAGDALVSQRGGAIPELSRGAGPRSSWSKDDRSTDERRLDQGTSDADLLSLYFFADLSGRPPTRAL
ncbi:hypothetical protein COL940_003618 [Colletotrichum noveboracense]|nr:hypothetical protein COL940_003618 [Colletotrichum noveboracense]